MDTDEKIRSLAYDLAMDCGCVWVGDPDAARASGVIEQYEKARSYGVTGDILVQCERHRAETAASVAATDGRVNMERERRLQRALDLEMDLAVRGKPIRRR